MLGWLARPVLGLFCVAALTAALLTGAADSGRAEMLSTGILSDKTDPAPAGASDPSATPPVSPFAGLRPPSTDGANVLSPPADPMVANVEGHPIYLSDLGQAVQSLPENLRKMPFEVIYPLLLQRMVDHEALVLMARREKLDDDPAVVRQVNEVTGRVLEGALLARTAVPQVTEAAIRARYERDFANQQPVEEVDARHILVGTEDQAKWLISELDKGADFATLAHRYSKDPDAARGGDIGFFRRAQVWKGFADLAFSLKPGEIGQTPIFNEFGWHVVQVLAKRMVPPPTLEQARDAIRKQLLQEAVARVIAQARQGLQVHEFNMNGAPMATLTSSDQPSPAAPGGPQTKPAGGQPAATTSAPGASGAPAPGASTAPQNPGN